MHTENLNSDFRFACGKLTRMPLDYYATSCPYCGEEVDVDIDGSAGSRQSYVQDCPVCCQPWQVDVRRDRDGDWEVTLRSD